MECPGLLTCVTVVLLAAACQPGWDRWWKGRQPGTSGAAGRGGAAV